MFYQDIEVPGKTPAWVHYYSYKHDKDFKVHWEDNEVIEKEYKEYMQKMCREREASVKREIYS